MKVVIIYKTGPAWKEGKPHWEQQLVPHRKYLVETLANKMLWAGPFMDHTGGLVIMELENVEEGMKVAENDPAVLEGKFVYEVHPWEPLEGTIRGNYKLEFPALETDRLMLTEVKDGHAPSIFEILSNLDVIKYYGMDPLKKLEQAEGIVKHFRNNFETKRGMRWAIILKEENKFVGTVGLNNLNISGRKAEVGFEIHPDYWRSGITSEAVKAVLDYSFNELNLNRMGAVTFTENEASQGLLKKIGFQQEGILRSYLFQNGESYDGYLFSILKSEWVREE